jgi:transposase InsO family protein
VRSPEGPLPAEPTRRFTGRFGRVRGPVLSDRICRDNGIKHLLTKLQAALDAWVADYNTARPHQSCSGRPPAERFQLAGRNRAAVEAGPVPEPAAPPAGTRRPAGVS